MLKDALSESLIVDEKALLNNSLSSKAHSLTIVELFAGAGGMALGFERNGFQHLLLNDQDKWCCETLRINRPDWTVKQADITALNFSHYCHQVDVVAGGFPCQSFSIAGKRQGLNDKRGQLFFELLRVVEQIQPKVVVAENVKGLLTHQKGRTLNLMITCLERCGYNVLAPRVLKAVQHHVPQRRERVFIIAIHRFLDHKKFEWPVPDDRIFTLRDALKAGTLFDVDVPDSEGYSYSILQHKFMEKIPPGGNWRCLPANWQKAFLGKEYGCSASQTGRRLYWDEPCLTLLTNPVSKWTGRCHPDETRPFTVREYARIQTFPDDWQFSGSVTEQYRQIGNAVPINLANAVADSVKKFLYSI
ncbi:MAG: DNA (cytosine-5-)-methyltransferase [Gammaproteobacteria bacterium]|nr:DNA (cytosine-5-)-methyltransferase [Gammaproteobacteria bacterium]